MICVRHKVKCGRFGLPGGFLPGGGRPGLKYGISRKIREIWQPCLQPTQLSWLPVFSNVASPSLRRQAATDNMLQIIEEHPNWPVCAFYGCVYYTGLAKQRGHRLMTITLPILTDLQNFNNKINKYLRHRGPIYN